LSKADRRAAIAASIGTAGFVLGFVFAPSDRRVAAAAYLLLLGTLALVAVARRLRLRAPGHEPSLFARHSGPALRLPIRRRSRRPTELEMLQGRLLVSGQNAADFHVRLRPILREIAAARLARAHGVVLDRDRDAARALLGDALWEVVRPDRPEPSARSLPGPGLEGLRPLIERLEEVG
jgi:hypothetical protein